MVFLWFVGLSMDEPVWDATTFTKNRERFVFGGLSPKFMEGVLEQARAQGLLSYEHFSVDGSLIEAWASMKSFKAKGGSGGGGRDSITDPDARLYRKGKGHEGKLCYMGHVLMENRGGLAVGGGKPCYGKGRERGCLGDAFYGRDQRKDHCSGGQGL